MPTPSRMPSAPSQHRDDRARARSARRRAAPITRPRTEPVRSNAVSAIAATGGTRPAPIAGAIAAIRLAAVPATIVIATVVTARAPAHVPGSSSRARRAGCGCRAARPMPPNSPAIEPSEADRRRLDQQRPGDLATTRADGAQQRVLPLALRGGDREHVVDHEHPDAEGDEREDRQEQRDEAEASLDLGLRLLGDLRRRQRLGDVRVERALDPLDAARRRRPSRRPAPARRRRSRAWRRTPPPSVRRTAPTCALPGETMSS